MTNQKVDMNLNPKVKFGAIIAGAIGVLVAVAAALGTLPSSPWAVAVAGVIATILPILAAYQKSQGDWTPPAPK